MPSTQLSPSEKQTGRVSSLKPKLKAITHFLMAQGATQAITTLLGFLCIRLLPVRDYALYSIVYGLLGTLTVLSDVGVSTTLTSLIGERVGDNTLVANYVETIRGLRRRLFLLAALVASAALPFLLNRQGWGLTFTLLIVLLVIVTLWSTTVSSSYGAVLILRRDRARYYRVQITAAAIRLFCLFMFWVTHSFNGVTAILANLSGVLYTSFVFYRYATELLGERGVASSDLRKKVLTLALPNLPNILFYAIQGQITIFIISILGHSGSIAGVGAVGRVGQLFTLFSQMNPVLVEPYFARMPEAGVARKYSLVAALCAGSLTLLVMLVWLWPEPLLALLGKNYSNLRTEVGLVVASSSISFFGGLVWTINYARRFVFWWASWTNIALILCAQAAVAFSVDLSTVRGVILLGLFTALAGTSVNVATGLVGFWKGPRVALPEVAV